MTGSRIALGSAVAHLAIAGVHAAAHVGLGVYQPVLDTAFIVLAIYVGPAVAVALLARRRAVAGAGWLLGASLVASWLYGAWHHFVVVSHDHVAHLPAGGWRGAFQVTAALLLVVDALGAAAGFALALHTSRPAGPRRS